MINWFRGVFNSTKYHTSEISASNTAKQNEKESSHLHEALDFSIRHAMHAHGIFCTHCQAPKLTNIKEGQYSNQLQEIGNAEIFDITDQVPCWTTHWAEHQAREKFSMQNWRMMFKFLFIFYGTANFWDLDMQENRAKANAIFTNICDLKCHWG